MRYAPENFERFNRQLACPSCREKDLAEKKTTKAPAAIVKVQLQLRPGPPSQ